MTVELFSLVDSQDAARGLAELAMNEAEQLSGEDDDPTEVARGLIVTTLATVLESLGEEFFADNDGGQTLAEEVLFHIMIQDEDAKSS